MGARGSNNLFAPQAPSRGPAASGERRGGGGGGASLKSLCQSKFESSETLVIHTGGAALCACVCVNYARKFRSLSRQKVRMGTVSVFVGEVVVSGGKKYLVGHSCKSSLSPSLQKITLRAHCSSSAPCNSKRRPKQLFVARN